MKKGVFTTIAGLVVLSLILLGVGLLVFKLFLADYYFAFFPVLILIFLLINSGFFVLFIPTLDKSNTQFVRSFMLTTGIKLMLYLILILVYVLTAPQSAVSFSVTLTILYIAYTAYDLYIMLTLLKRRKEKNSL
jgi:hypothetical protein